MRKRLADITVTYAGRAPRRYHVPCIVADVLVRAIQAAAVSRKYAQSLHARTLAGSMALVARRWHRRMSQEALAEAAGICAPAISAMENGKRVIGEDVARRLAKVLRCDWRELTTLE